MSRSGYSDNIGEWDLIRWRGQVASAIRGARGQKLLRELLASLDAMPEKRLIVGDLRDADGEHCTLGVLGEVRGLPLETIDPEDYEQVADAFGVAHQLVQEVVFENDEACFSRESPEERWKRMRAWVAARITASPAEVA